MKRKNTTRNALVMSVLSMLLCVSMLVGTTFAWFTDEVVTGMNTITAGNLDIEVTNDAGESIQNVEELFSDITLWEPGVVAYENLYVSNEGTLALRYNLKVNFANQNYVTDNGLSLADVLKVAVIEGTVSGDNREALVNSIPAADWALLSDLTMSGDLLRGEDEAFAIVIWWEPSDKDNQWNVNNGRTTSDGQPLHIDLGINVFATQLMYEEDSFDNKYDQFALVNNAEELAAAVAEGGAVVLASDIDLGNTTITVPADKAVDLELNGHTISYTAPAEEATYHAFVVKGDLNVIGDGSIALKDASGAAFNSGIQSTAISVQGGVLTLNEGVTVASEAGAEMAYAVDVNTTLGESVLNVNGATLYSSYIGVRIFNNHATEKGIVNYNSGIISGAKKNYDIWAQQMSHPAENAVVNIASGISYTTTSISGTIYSFEGSVAATATELKAMLAEGNHVTLVADLVVNETVAVPAGADVVLDLNGNTLSGAFSNQGVSALITNSGNLTIVNGKVVSLAEYPDVDWGEEGFPTYATNTISNRGNLVIGAGAVVENETNVGGASYAVDNYAGATLTVEAGAQIIAKDCAIRMFSGSATAENKVVINGGTITGKRAIWIQLPSSNAAVAPLTTLIINGGELNSTSDLTIYSYSYGNSFANTNVTITGGIFEKDVAFGGGYKGDQETVVITGGTFNGKLGRYLAGDGWEDIAKP